MRRIVLSLLPLLVAAPLAGQTMVGIRAGLNRSTISAEDEPPTGQNARMGIVIGVDAALPLAGAIELRVGGAYAQKGSGFAEEGFGSVSVEVDYFQLSALARMGTPRNEGLSVGVLLGPWVAFSVSCNLGANLDLGDLGPVNESVSCEDEFEGTDFGIAAGAGVELAVSDGLRLGLDVVYALGLANLDAESDDGKNRSLSVPDRSRDSVRRLIWTGRFPSEGTVASV